MELVVDLECVAVTFDEPILDAARRCDRRALTHHRPTRVLERGEEPDLVQSVQPLDVRRQNRQADVRAGVD